ncbi:phosphoribosylanthranilate isomerase [Halalkalibacillus sediminis]|uniref:N-(5'-phosphoribosyl)anthranilate isomerase n=1 Tax=Halalkalibacillus sediminis TaxID=2018042 RepID=A0A2I0QS12_9BACI|nr:phosphoribosylanthranilate isomerase [Halalkalibacillus sediminis]PKR77145.1 phosphoribosylanthranilate isomerase [Halalkalibacillus sediminis]
MTGVKICGIQQTEHAKAAVDAGAEMIGFVFAESKRKVSLNQARDIAQHVPETVKKVGVFVNAPKQELLETARLVGLDYVQLHGDEEPDFCETLSIPYIKSLSVRHESDLQILDQYSSASYFLLDSANGPYRGGNGTTFDWSLIDQDTLDRERFILAGGLNEDNVTEAISTTNPAVVDVSSGVETDGVKDIEKIQRFIKQVKNNN